MNKFLKSNFESIALFSLLTVSLVMMIYSAVGDSLIFDELAHIPAGYSYVKYFDYRLNIEHPPLIKALSGIPLLFLNLKFPLNNASWENFNQWGIGNQFIFESGNDADRIIFWARLVPIFLTLLLIFFTYLCVKDLVGKRWALLPIFFLALSPNILAHGHYVTTDIGVSLFIFLAIYCFSKYIIKPSLYLLIISALTFGFAQLAKFSALILVPIFIALAIVYAFNNKQWMKLFKSTLLVFLFGYLLVYSVYFVFSLNYSADEQVKNTEFILGFSDLKRAETTRESCLKEDIGARLKTKCVLKKTFIQMSGNKLARPMTQYLTGAWLVFKQSTLAHHLTFFNGSICDCGRWYYFPVLFLLKEPISGLIFILSGLICGIYIFIRKVLKDGFKTFSNHIINHFTEFSFLFFIVIYGIYGIRSNLNIGVRHILPIIIPAYILATITIKKMKINDVYKKFLIIILIVLYSFEVFIAMPYFISYFNKFGKGVWGGYNYAVDSNYDWGQDLKRLAIWTKDNNVDKIFLSYFGAGNAKYYLGNKVDFWNNDQTIIGSKDFDLFAVSAHLLKQYPEDYFWLKSIDNPDYRVGTSIFIYKF